MIKLHYMADYQTQITSIHLPSYYILNLDQNYQNVNPKKKSFFSISSLFEIEFDYDLEDLSLSMTCRVI